MRCRTTALVKSRLRVCKGRKTRVRRGAGGAAGARAVLDSAYMWRRVRVSIGVVAGGLFGLLVLLALLQYRWLGQISDAERAQRRATVAKGAADFAQDFDREITRAYLVFQADPPAAFEPAQLDDRFAARYEHWQASARFPRLINAFYAFSQNEDGTASLRRYDPASRSLQAAEWPAAMANWRTQLTSGTQHEKAADGATMYIRQVPPPIWESVPAIVVPVPMFLFTAPVPADEKLPRAMAGALARVGMNGSLGYTILVIDREYVARELLPALAQRYFSQHREGEAAAAPLDFRVAVVDKSAGGAPIFQSAAAFAPAPDAHADAAADMFQVRTQDFTALVSEVRRFTSFVSTMHAAPPAGGVGPSDAGRPVSIVIQQSAASAPGGARTSAAGRVSTGFSAPLWRLVVAHPSGSLESAVDAARRRNLAISFSVLGILGASMALLVLATRRAQRLATQQLEFVATVSHELRTPLAVIRSAAENLADGVVGDEQRIRRYGEVMRTEGRRLSEMVEQILEFSGIQSGQRHFTIRPLAIPPLLRGIVSSSAAIIERAGVSVEMDLPDDLPEVAGDEAALRRVFQNLIDNAVKYGASGAWMKISARRTPQGVDVIIADRGIGIDPAEHSRIFEPFYRAPAVVAAQTHGAGLGLSLVQRIVAAHGGRVSVHSQPPSGSEFTVQLPIAPAGMKPRPVRDALAPPAVDPGSPAHPRYS
jgi:signal transduction histidine kinase